MFIDADHLLYVTRSNPTKLFTTEEIERICYRADYHEVCRKCEFCKEVDDAAPEPEFICLNNRGSKGMRTEPFAFCDSWEAKE